MDRRTALLSSIAVALPDRAAALSLSALSGAEAVAGLKEVLSQGAANAVDRLGRADGFLGDPKVRIPLPAGLRRVERVLRATGAGPRIDELVVSMNRAAEAAVPQARPLLLGAVRELGVDDAKAILGGGDDAATRYFRERTAEALAARLQPVVGQETARLGIAQRHDRLAAEGVRLGLVRREDATLDRYVTRKALDGLYAVMAVEERAIRRDPGAAAGGIARRVFTVAR